MDHRIALTPGRTATVSHVVTPADTAVAVGSGDVDVLATPRVVALMEAATCRVVEGALPPGSTTVGVRVDVEHMLPSYVGAEVVAEATLVEVDARRLRFRVRLHDGDRLAAAGMVTRAVVERARFTPPA